MKFFPVFLVVLCWMAVLETSLRLVNLRMDGSLFIRDDVRRFRLRPNARAWFAEEGEALVTINSRGLRDRERTPGPHPDIFRIAVIGDSGVAGFQVTQPETFTQVAENALPRTEVINFGTPNYNLAQQYLVLRDDVFAYQPDLVIDAVSLTNAILNSTPETCVNDSPYPYFIQKNGGLELYDPPQPKSLDRHLESALLDLENRSQLALLFLRAKRNFTELVNSVEQRAHLKSPLPADFYERSLFPPRDENVAKAWKISEQTLALMKNLCASHHVPFWIMTMDVPGQVHPDPQQREQYRRRLGAPDLYYADSRLIHFAETESIPRIQIAPALGAYTLRTGKPVHGFFNTPPNFGHLNAEGHRVVGELLAREIEIRESAAAESPANWPSPRARKSPSDQLTAAADARQ